MKGKILNYNIENASGVISADNGKRYLFSSSQWKSEEAPTAKQIVDFNIDENESPSIYLDKDTTNTSSTSDVSTTPESKGGIIDTFLKWFRKA